MSFRSWLKGSESLLTCARASALGVLLAALVGCVTETTGVPQPADADSRVQAQLDLARGYLEQGNTERARTAQQSAGDRRSIGGGPRAARRAERGGRRAWAG